ncbi:uncharacterized protein [Lolium perenne]|uniref:uncharacterized protein n=1 Tax=Lolium perenne TaxID=4522 RepID=UPI0021F50BEC|nr:uncharacterized protein LOC127328429 [Lolium perenne]
MSINPNSWRKRKGSFSFSLSLSLRQLIYLSPACISFLAHANDLRSPAPATAAAAPLLAPSPPPPGDPESNLHSCCAACVNTRLSEYHMTRNLRDSLQTRITARLEAKGKVGADAEASWPSKEREAGPTCWSPRSVAVRGNSRMTKPIHLTELSPRKFRARKKLYLSARLWSL